MQQRTEPLERYAAHCRHHDTATMAKPGWGVDPAMTVILIAAFAAGMVSTVNPCGFAMLPAYLGYFLGEDEDRHTGRIGTVGLSVAAGFLSVFSAAGILIGIGVRSLIDAIPWMALLVGVGLVVVGVGQVVGKRLVPYLRGPSRVRNRGSLGGMFAFGVSYAVASLSCTLPIFLSLVTGAVASRSMGEAVLTFVAYGSGMAMVVVGLTVAVATGRSSIIGRIRPLASHLDTISGWIMTASGLFIVWYWATVLTAGTSTLGINPIVRSIDRWSATVIGFVADRPLVVAVVAIAALGWGSASTGRRPGPKPGDRADADSSRTARGRRSRVEGSDHLDREIS